MKKMNIPFSPPDISESEIEAVSEALRSGWITTGPKTKEFENKIANYCGTNKAVCLNSATAAMELTLRLLGVGPGDEVITSAYTYTASASVIHHVGAKIVLVDTQPNSLEMDYNKLSEAINENTKVIIPIDIAGVMIDYDKLYEIIEQKKNIYKSDNEIQNKINRIAILADAAHSFGAKNDKVVSGNAADFTCFSFHAVKNLTTAEGGAVTWSSKLLLDDEQIYNEFMLLSLHGQSKDALSKSQLGAWEYDIIYPAYKSNMTDISAAIGLVQLERYNDLMNRRREIISIYNEAFIDTPIQVLNHNHSSGHLYMTRIPNIGLQERNNIIIKLAEKGISANVHYKPLPLLTAYKNLGFEIEDYPNAYNYFINEITLPLHTCLTNEEIEYIINNYIEILTEYIEI